MAEDLAERRAGDQERVAVMRNADAVGEIKLVDEGAGGTGGGVIADQPPVRPRLENVQRIGRHLVARGTVAEIDLAIRGDVEIVGHAQPRVVIELVPRAIGFIGYLEHFAARPDAIDSHARYADDEVLVAIELHAERPAADMREDFPVFEVAARETDDIAVAR